MRRIARLGMMLWLLLLCLPSSAAQADKPSIIVFAAASLTNALQEVGDGFTRDSSIPVKFSFAASSALARQIENGAPADVFFSADIEWMDYLQGRQLIRVPTRHDVVGNHLVLVAPADSVRTALAFVDRGEAALGIVYATDAEIDKKVRVVDVFPDNTHLPIVYPIALTAAAKPDALKFVDYVRSSAGDATFKKYGFQPLH